MTAVLFDLDDTLFDHVSAQHEGLVGFHRHFAAELGGTPVDLEERWIDAIERNYQRYLAGEIDATTSRRERVRTIFDRPLDDRAADEVFAVYLEHYRSSWKLFDDVTACLRSLAGFKLGVVTNAEREHQLDKLCRLGLSDLFSVLVTPADAKAAKPSKLIFHEACRQLGMPPARCWYVGDHYAYDAVGARAAGLRPIWLDRYGERDSHDCQGMIVINSLAELPRHVLRARSTAQT
jgi:putative hydrolase of the HAD superfamily